MTKRKKGYRYPRRPSEAGRRGDVGEVVFVFEHREGSRKPTYSFDFGPASVIEGKEEYLVYQGDLPSRVGRSRALGVARVTKYDPERDIGDFVLLSGGEAVKALKELGWPELVTLVDE